MNLDIATTFKVLLTLLGIGVIASLVIAFKSLNTARTLKFYRKRQDLLAYGWRLIFFAILMVGVGFVFYRFGEPVAYHYFPPSPTITRTPTITTTPTITLTLQNTLTPTITPTLEQTYTPMLPPEAIATIITPVIPDSKAVFSPVQFSREIDKDGIAINTTDTFTLPITSLYAGYSYDKMDIGVRWTAVWLFEGNYLCAETQIWEYATGALGGYSDWCNQKITPDMWKSGDYEVQIFVGHTWKTSGRFTILGNEPTLDPSVSVTNTLDLPQVTLTPSLTPKP
jgi:type VI secretion system secreted protein VgrG